MLKKANGAPADVYRLLPDPEIHRGDHSAVPVDRSHLEERNILTTEIVSVKRVSQVVVERTLITKSLFQFAVRSPTSTQLTGILPGGMSLKPVLDETLH